MIVFLDRHHRSVMCLRTAKIKTDIIISPEIYVPVSPCTGLTFIFLRVDASLLAMHRSHIISESRCFSCTEEGAEAAENSCTLTRN